MESCVPLLVEVSWQHYRRCSREYEVGRRVVILYMLIKVADLRSVVISFTEKFGNHLLEGLECGVGIVNLIGTRLYGTACRCMLKWFGSHGGCW